MTTDPMWTPSAERADGSLLAAFARDVASRHELPAAEDSYGSLWRWSIEQPEAFWGEALAASGIEATPHSAVLGSREMPGAEWFPGATLNFSANLLRHAASRADQPALIATAEGRDDETISYGELLTAVERCAGALAAAGVVAGDRVAGVLPNGPHAVIAMLAATRLGAIWSSCSPDFGRQGVLDRFGQIEPKVLICADGYRYGGKAFDRLERAAEICASLPSLERVVVVGWLNEAPDLSALPQAVGWDAFLGEGHAAPDPVAMPFDAPVYILYSSGTTGVPKCIVHGAGGTLLQHWKELALHTDVREGDVLFYYTTCGWMMWNWLVSGLLVGATLVLTDGSPAHPDLDRLWAQVDRHGITHFGTSPKFLGICRTRGLEPGKTHSLATLRTILSTGAPLLPEDFDYVYEAIKADLQLASISGGTDIISCFALGCPTRPVHRGQLQCRGLGMAVEAFDADGEAVRGAKGELVCTQPAPSMPVAFWQDPDRARYRKAYFERFAGVWCHGDYVEITPEDGLMIFGRSDATLNPGGVRIGTAEIYRLVETTAEVDDSLAVGVDHDGDQHVVLFVVMAEGVTLDDALRDRLRKRIREGATPRHVPAVIHAVADVPYTISGKKVELAVGQLLAGGEPANRDALKNPEALDLYRGLKLF